MKIVCGNQKQVYRMKWATRTRQVRQYAVYQVSAETCSQR